VTEGSVQGRLVELIDEFRSVLESRSDLRLPPLEPAPGAEIEQAEDHLGRALPDDLKALYRIANRGFVLCWELHPVATIAEYTAVSAEDWQEILDVLEEYGDGEVGYVTPEGDYVFFAVSDAWSLAYELDGPQRGRIVCQVGGQEPESAWGVAAPSLIGFVECIVDLAESGFVELRPKGVLPYVFPWFTTIDPDEIRTILDRHGSTGAIICSVEPPRGRE
jgi:hypothetical protein